MADSIGVGLFASRYCVRVRASFCCREWGCEAMAEPTAERVRELLSYNPETGKFRWRIKRLGCSSGKCGTINQNGYHVIRLDFVAYKAHVLAWYYVTGVWPDRFVDHIDGDKLNNKFENLRLATPGQNAMNRKMHKNNKSGFKGVTYNRLARKWQANITVNRKIMYLGLYVTPEEAHDAYCKAAVEYHGEFCRSTQLMFW